MNLPMVAWSARAGFKPNAALLALWTVYLVWGTTFAAIHWAIQDIPPGLMASSRFLAAGLGMLLVGWLATSAGDRPTRSQWLKLLMRNGAIGFFLFGLGNTMSGYGLQYLPTGMGSVFTATAMFWMTGMGASLPPREPTSPAVWTLLVVGFTGLLLMLSPQLLRPGAVHPDFWLGVACFNVMALSWSVGSLLAKRWAPQGGMRDAPLSANSSATPSAKSSAGHSIFLDVGLQNLVASLSVWPVATAGLNWHALHLHLPSVAAWLYLVLFGSMVATPCYIYVVRTMPMAVSGSFAYVTPLVSVFVGTTLLGETLSWPMAMGMGVILASVVYLQRYATTQPAAKPKAATLPACLAPCVATAAVGPAAVSTPASNLPAPLYTVAAQEDCC
ncbi:MAG: EamA family transporter [Cyanobacteria bacterium HKST-UBA04]|nr:EamA family transporter [Cyanobacteria bacterium HKST-UBA04]